MTNLLNSGMNAVMKAFSGQAPTQVIDAIQGASARTGVDFSYLMQQAKVESSFNPEAQAKTSSAGGLFQFIKSTWLDMVDRHGEKYGIDTESMSKKELLDLRYDPEIASNMAAEFASENKNYLDRSWGGEVGATELYMAHFLGAGGASSFLKAKDADPLRVAADIFPKAATANRNVFYNANGSGKTVAEVYETFDKKFSTLPTVSSSEPEMMKLPPRKPRTDSSLYNEKFYNNNINNNPQSVVRVRKSNPLPTYNLVQSPVELMILAEMDSPFQNSPGKEGRSKLF